MRRLPSIVFIVALIVGNGAACASSSSVENSTDQDVLVVSVSTDMDPVQDVPDLRLVATMGGEVVYSLAFEGLKYPATWLVRTKDLKLRNELKLVAIAGKDNRPKVVRQVTLRTLPSGPPRLVPILLSYLCADRLKTSSDGAQTSQGIAENAKSDCPQGNDTCVGGSCVSSEVVMPDETLVPYEPGLVFGGGATKWVGTCFDTQAVFGAGSGAEERDLPPKEGACILRLPNALSVQNVALKLPPSVSGGSATRPPATGICLSDSKRCVVPLAYSGNKVRMDQWRPLPTGDGIELPMGACDPKLVDKILVSSRGPSRTEGDPPCGIQTWSGTRPKPVSVR